MRSTAALFWLLATLFLAMAGFFLSYALNYRTLVIRVSHGTGSPRFGVFRKAVAVDDIEDCRPDDTPPWRSGGAAIHFTFIDGRYRMYRNFLEHPRLVLDLRRGGGPGPGGGVFDPAPGGVAPGTGESTF